MEIRQSYDRLISTMGFPILVRWHLYIESAPRYYAIRFPIMHMPSLCLNPKDVGSMSHWVLLISSFHLTYFYLIIAKRSVIQGGMLRKNKPVYFTQYYAEIKLEFSALLILRFSLLTEWLVIWWFLDWFLNFNPILTVIGTVKFLFTITVVIISTACD